MFIIYGQKHYGKVDHVPGLFYVVTEFLHVWYVPLIPVKSQLVVDGSEDGSGFKGLRIPMNFKSVFMAWYRAALVLMVFAGLAVGCAEASRPGFVVNALFVPAVMVIGGIFLYWLSSSSRASYDRALALGEQAGLPAEYIEKSFAPREPQLETYDEPDRYPT
jgi:hypothetical protein